MAVHETMSVVHAPDLIELHEAHVRAWEAVLHVLPFLRAGFGLVPIPLGEKGPRSKGWQQRKAAVVGEENAKRFVGMNAGIVHEWSKTCAIDIDDFDKADGWLTPRGVSLEALFLADGALSVSSGRSNHGKLIYRLAEGVEPLATTKVTADDGRVILEFRCAGSQDVIGGRHPEGTDYTVRGDPATMPILPDELWGIWRSQFHTGKASAEKRMNSGARFASGGRNDALTCEAGRLRRLGLSAEAIAAALQQINLERCDPPLDAREVLAIAESVARYAAAEGQPDAPNATAGAGLCVLTLAELLTHEFPEREAILAPWLLTQSLSMIHAWRGVGKTHVALGIAYAVATGGKFLTWGAPRPRRVLYIDGEMPGAALCNRLRALVEADERDLEPSNLLIITPDAQDGPMPDLATDDGQEAIERIVAAHDVELIIVDNISTLCRNTGPENDAESWRTPQEWALQMRRAGRAALFIHHDGKGGSQRGSSKKEDTLDVVIQLKRPPNYSPDEGARFEVHFEKYRNGSGDEAKPIEAKLATDPDGRVGWTWRSVEESTFDRVVGLRKDGLKPGEIAKELRIDKSRVSRHLKRARELGLVLIKGGHEDGS